MKNTFLPRFSTDPQLPSVRREQEVHSHATAGGNLAAVSEPSDLRPGEAVYPRRVHQGTLALGHGLGSLGLHEAAHIWQREKTRWGAGRDKGRMKY